MQFFILILLVCLLVFLYIIYFLSKDDLIIIRKNVAMEFLFNTVFLTAFSSLFFSRLLYVLIHPRPVFHTMLGFLLFPYFPGLSLAGAIIGGLLFLYPYLKNKEMPYGRIMDFFSLGMLAALSVGYLGVIILSEVSARLLALFTLYLIGSISMLKFLFPLFLRGRIRDGSLALILIALVSFFSMVSWFLDNNYMKFFETENTMLFILFCFSLSLFIFREFINTSKK
ncbi:MAG: prolipoprotein diacylglyceryl transferase family protein [Candidatus Levyibacteriota bacterium]